MRRVRHSTHDLQNPRSNDMPAYFDTGFSVREPMWHGEGLVLEDYPTDWNDARVKAGLQWEPRSAPVFARKRVEMMDAWVDLLGPEDRIVATHEAERFAEVDVRLTDWQVIERDDTQAPLGIVTDSFELVMHKEMGEIIEAIVGAGAKFETAGSCKGGAQVWALAYLDEPLVVAKDDTETYPYLALLNSHDGSGACKLVNGSIRVVCWNTYQAMSMQGDKTGRQFTFRHTSGVHDRIEDAKQALSGVRADAELWNEIATDLLGMPADEAALNHFIADFIPEPPAEVVSPRVRNNIERARATFKHLYLDSVTCGAHVGTALGLVDAAVEYLDHVRDYRNADTYMGRTLLRPEPLKAKALTLARAVCSR